MARSPIRRYLLVGVVLSAVPAVVFGSLVFADWTEARYWTDGVPRQVKMAIDHGDRLHFVGHLAVGRLFDLCRCAEEIAADQYHRANAHATTARQRALVTSDRPQRFEEAVSDIGGILVSGLRWAQRGSTWVLMRLPLG
jgi:hypothetical protein